MGFALIMVCLVSETNMPMVSVLLVLHELSHGHRYESYTVVTFFSCILVMRCEHMQGNFIYVAQMGNRSVAIDRMVTPESSFMWAMNR
jgi:hypothetical protein